MKPKILLFDIETAPMISYLWSIWKEAKSMDFVIKDWYVLAASWKMLGEKKTVGKILPDYKTYKKDPENDYELVKEIHDAINSVDIIIGHNVDNFDLAKMNARFIYHNLGPISPTKSIDTLKEAKKYFKFSSNRLNDIGQFLGLGKKIDTGGIELWKDVIAGKKSAWEKMRKYNKNDTVLLEKVYLKMMPFIKNHPNLNLYAEKKEVTCPKCLSKDIIFRGNYVAYNTKYKRIFCNSCSSWLRSRIPVLEKETKKNLIVNAL